MADPPPTDPGPTVPGHRTDVAAFLACAAVGLVLAIAPHLATLARHGTLDYLADGDDVLYLTIARAPFHGEWALRDPFARQSDHMPTLYPWAQFVPFTLPARWMGLGILRVSLVWRTIGGLLLGGSLYLLLRRLLGETRHPTAWAMGLSLVCLADAGFVDGRMLVSNYGLYWHMALGTTPLGKADAMGQYRVVTPLLNLPFLILMVAGLVPPAGRGRAWTWLGAACLGACFHLYFFYWTAAIAALAASTLVSLATGRRQAARSSALVLIGGMALGVPQVYANARTFADPAFRPILERMGRGRVVSPDDPVRTRYLENRWAWAKIGAGGLAILAFRLRRIAPVWWLTVAGFALANSSLLTGLEFENFHWAYVHATMGEVLILAAGAMLLDRWNPGRAVRNRLLWVVPGVLLAVAAAWRPYEALYAPDAVSPNELADMFQGVGLDRTMGTLGPDRILAGPIYLDVALLFGRCGLLYHEPHSYLSSLLTDESAHERHALNAWLQGVDLAEYRRIDRRRPFRVVPSGDARRWSAPAAARRRVAIFEAIEADDGAALLARYRPDVLILADPTGDRIPTRGGPWRRLAQDGHLTTWIRDGSAR